MESARAWRLLRRRFYGPTHSPPASGSATALTRITRVGDVTRMSLTFELASRRKG